MAERYLRLIFIRHKSLANHCAYDRNLFTVHKYLRIIILSFLDGISVQCALVICKTFLYKDFTFTDEEFGERSVSVVLDGAESELVFIDHAHGEMSVSGHARLSVAA